MIRHFGAEVIRQYARAMRSQRGSHWPPSGVHSL